MRKQLIVLGALAGMSVAGWAQVRPPQPPQPPSPVRRAEPPELPERPERPVPVQRAERPPRPPQVHEWDDPVFHFNDSEFAFHGLDKLQQSLGELRIEQLREPMERAQEQMRLLQEQRLDDMRFDRMQLQEARIELENMRLIAPISIHSGDFRVVVPPAWAQGDVADSLYKNARELFNRGDYRRAAVAFREISQKYSNSSYAPSALYYQAHALYRIGNTADLQEALAALETLRSKYPNRDQGDAASLNTRILGILAARGDAKAAAELKSAAANNQQSCDREEQAVRAEALNALSRTEPENMSALMKTVLARKDECSVQLRRTAVFLVGNKKDAEAGSVLTSVAKNDPSVDVRVTAIDYLARISSDEGLNTLTDLAKSTSEDERIQRAAVRALVNHPSTQARQLVRGIVERNDMPERLRIEALNAFDRDRASVDDISWLRSIYGKIDNPRIRQRALQAIVRVSGPETDQFLMSIVKDENETSEFRATALRRIGTSMSVADIGKMYDGASARSVRESLIEILSNRKEPEATDKLIDIAKNGTDPNMRTRAISALANSKDPRARQLLLEIINK